MTALNPPILSRIAHVALGVSDVDAAIEFYHDIFGLEAIERRDGRAYLASGRSTSFDLEIGPEDNGLDHFAFGVYGLEGLAAAREQLTGAGVAVSDTDADNQPGLAGGFEFALPDGHVMELVALSEPRGFITSADPPPSRHRATGPVPLEHVTLLSPDVQTAAEFVIEQFGFRITDSWRPGGETWCSTWMRIAEHHRDLAFLAADISEPQLHHFCFAVPSVADLVRVADAVAARGIVVDASIGRHRAGNNVFLYFKDPFGNRIEVNTDMARIDPAAPPRIRHDQDPFPFDAWGIERPTAMEAGSPCRDGSGV